MAKKKTVRKRATKKQDTVPFQRDDSAETFRQHVFRTNFQLTLSHAMIEMLCAVSEDVWWDRVRESTLYRPDNMIASKVSLCRRGLIRQKPDYQKRSDENPKKDFWSQCRSLYELTPAGEAIVNLFKVTGIFIESENAEIRRMGG